MPAKQPKHRTGVKGYAPKKKTVAKGSAKTIKVKGY